MIRNNNVLATQFHLVGFILEQNTDQLKNLIVKFASIWPNLEECPIDREVLRMARRCLEEEGWMFDVSQVGRGLVLIAPNGDQYASHKNGTPKYTTL